MNKKIDYNVDYLYLSYIGQVSKWIVTMCRPGTMTRPRALASVCSSDKYSEQDPRMTLASRSVHKNAPVNTRPSVIFIFRCRLSHPRNFCLAGDSSICGPCVK